MSELTSYYYYEDRVITPATHQYRVYHADEADKVIAHSKYKRCLAMALWCSAEIGTLAFFCGPRINYYKRWQKRWLKIAEKFKDMEAK